MTVLDVEAEELRSRLRDSTPFWTAGMVRDASGCWQKPAPDAFKGCVEILDKSRKRVRIIPHDWQLEFDDKLEEQKAAGQPMRAIVLKARKLGFSTWIALKMLQRVTQVQYQQAIVVAQDVKTASIVFNMARLAHAHLPTEEELGLGFNIRPAIIQSNFTATGRKYMEFGEPSRRLRLEGVSGESTFEIDTARSDESGRGYTPWGLHLSEVARWEGNQADRKMLALLEAMPYEPGTLCVLESTANGLNHFYRRWQSAVAGAQDPDTGESYFAMFVPWWRDRGCAREFSSADARERFIEGIGNVKRHGQVAEDEPMLVDLYACTPEQLLWRRMKVREQPDQSIETFNQENPHCLTCETRVSTEAGIVPIGEAQGVRETESGPVKHWFPQAKSPILKLVTKQGRIVRGTGVHPISTPEGCIDLAHLVRGQRIDLRAPRFAKGFHRVQWAGALDAYHGLPITAPLGRFLGYFMGDGSWHNGVLAFSLDAKDEDVIADVTTLTTRFVKKPARRTIARVQGRKGMVELRARNIEAQALLKRLGCISAHSDGDRLRRTVRVPDAIWRSPRPVVRQFLRALFECDGSASNDYVRWGSSKLGFARDIQLLLLGFGLNASLFSSKKKDGSGKDYEFHALQLGGDAARAFHDRIGFVGERKRAARPMPGLPGIGRPCRGLQMWDEVLSVEPDGEEVTYDFTMDTKEHLFMANGVLTHNSPESAFIGSGRTVYGSILVSKAIKAAEKAPEPVAGTLRPLDVRERRTRAGTVIVPGDALWVPSSAMRDDEPTLEVWEHPFKGAEVAALELPPAPTLMSSPAALEAAERAAAEGAMVEADKPAGAYIIFADVSQGEENTFSAGDYHAVQVFDHRSHEQVAVHESRMPLHLLPMWLFLLGIYYNTAWLGVEVNGPGVATVEVLVKDLRYPRMYRRKRVDTVRKTEEERPGWETTGVTKPVMEAALGVALQDGTHGIRHRKTARQLSTYIVTEKGKHEAQHGEHDDLLIATMGAHRLMDEIRAPSSGKRRKYQPDDIVTGY